MTFFCLLPVIVARGEILVGCKRHELVQLLERRRTDFDGVPRHPGIVAKLDVVRVDDIFGNRQAAERPGAPVGPLDRALATRLPVLLLDGNGRIV